MRAAMDRARHELLQVDGELAARAVLRRETHLMIGNMCALAGAVLALGLALWQGAAWGIVGMLLGAACGVFASAIYVGIRATRATRLEMHARGQDVRMALVGDDLEVVAPAGTTRMRATRAELRRLRIGALPAARVHELR